VRTTSRKQSSSDFFATTENARAGFQPDSHVRKHFVSGPDAAQRRASGVGDVPAARAE
jgi:hypothetical protein